MGWKKTQNTLAKEDGERNRKGAIHLEVSTKHYYRRAFSQSKLLDIAGIKVDTKNSSHHFISMGDVDALSYLMWIMLFCDQITEMLFSTWCMNAQDILMIEEWHKKGKINKCDAYLGEIFPKSYKNEYATLKSVYERNNLGRIAVFRNHSKIFAGKANNFSFCCEMSANINTNPRCENAVVTFSETPEVYEFYKSFYDGIKCIDGNDKKDDKKDDKKTG